jgi:hypothetical protein
MEQLGSGKAVAYLSLIIYGSWMHKKNLFLSYLPSFTDHSYLLFDMCLVMQERSTTYRDHSQVPIINFPRFSV